MSVTLAAHYRLERRLGEGGMAVVWAATDERSGERVAIKCLKPGVASADAKRRLKREARSIAAIAHPNVIRVREVLALEEGAPAIVMDLLEGETLRARLDREGRLSLGETCRIMLEAISALGSAHAAHIVHRDLKPDNVFLVADPAGGPSHVRVLDFGIAKVMAEGEAARSALTSTGVLVGTPYYMAPEQVFGEKDLDARCDVWAIGVVLFECLVGRRPIEGDNAGQVLRAITMGKVERLAAAAPQLPEAITSLVDRMTTPQRTSRPSDLREISDVLHALSDKQPTTFGAATIRSRWMRAVGAGLAVGLLVPIGVEVSRLSSHPTPQIARRDDAPVIVPSMTASSPPLPVASVTVPVEPQVMASPAVVQRRPTIIPVAASARASTRPDATSHDFDHQ